MHNRCGRPSWEIHEGNLAALLHSERGVGRIYFAHLSLHSDNTELAKMIGGVKLLTLQVIYWFQHWWITGFFKNLQKVISQIPK